MLDRVESLARRMAIFGGSLLAILVVMVCLSILGRSANSLGHSEALEASLPWLASALVSSGLGPVPGDFELVEAGIGLAIFSFLPICQLYGAHATVDVFTSSLSGRLNAWLRAFWEVLLSLVILLITWRLIVGTLDKLENGETTFILQFPVWWALAASAVAACAASFVAVYCAYARVMEALTSRRFMPTSEGADH